MAKSKKDLKRMNPFNSAIRIWRMVIKELKLFKTDKFNLFIALFLVPTAITLYGIMINQASVQEPIPIAIVSNDSNTFLSFDFPDPTTIPDDLMEYYQEQFDIALEGYLNGSFGYEDVEEESEIYDSVLSNNTIISTYHHYESAIINAFNKSTSLNIKYYYNGSIDYYGINDARLHLERKEIQCIVVIPADFSELILLRLPGLLDTIPDTSNIEDVQRILNAVQEGVDIFTDDMKMTPQFVIENNMEYEINADYNLEYNYRVITILSFIIFGVSCILTILIVVQEKTLARLLLTPLKKFEILTSKYLAYIFILIGQILLIYFTVVLNGLYVAGSLIDLFIVMFLIGFIGVSLGIFISTLSKNIQQANQYFFALFIIIVIFSGIFIPISAMPPYLQFFANYLPLSHGQILLRGIISRGMSYNTINFTFLIQEAIGLTIASYILFYKKEYQV